MSKNSENILSKQFNRDDFDISSKCNKKNLDLNIKTNTTLKNLMENDSKDKPFSN